MTTNDWEAVRRDKDALHARNAARPLVEKFAQLDRLREMIELVRARKPEIPSPLDSRVPR